MDFVDLYIHRAEFGALKPDYGLFVEQDEKENKFYLHVTNTGEDLEFKCESEPTTGTHTNTILFAGKTRDRHVAAIRTIAQELPLAKYRGLNLPSIFWLRDLYAALGEHGILNTKNESYWRTRDFLYFEAAVCRQWYKERAWGNSVVKD